MAGMIEEQRWYGLNFLEKLDYLMEKEGMNRHTLSQASGVPYSTIDSFYKKGYERAKLATLKKLAECFGTTLDYLMRDEITDCGYGLPQGQEMTVTEAEMLSRYRRLDRHGREAVDFTMQRELVRMEEVRAARRRKAK